jgi:hypothetical protein
LKGHGRDQHPYYESWLGRRGRETSDTFQFQQKPKTMVGTTKIFDTTKTMERMFIVEAQAN